MHARACRTGYEILTLLDAGLASAAHARWRSLHEVAAVAFFVKEHGPETAERYLATQITLPCHHALQQEDMHDIVAAVQKVAAATRR